MKKIIIITTLVLSSLIAKAQDLPKNWIGIYSSVSESELLRFGGELIGGASYYGQGGYLIGFEYIRELNDLFDIATGLNMSKNSLNSSYIDASGNLIKNTKPLNIDLWSIPLSIRLKTKRRFFIAGGIQMDKQINIKDYYYFDNQTGIGLNFSLGKDFLIKDKFIISLVPEILIHDIIAFNPEKHQQRLIEVGIKASFMFGL